MIHKVDGEWAYLFTCRKCGAEYTIYANTEREAALNFIANYKRARVSLKQRTVLCGEC